MWPSATTLWERPTFFPNYFTAIKKPEIAEADNDTMRYVEEVPVLKPSRLFLNERKTLGAPLRICLIVR